MRGIVISVYRKGGTRIRTKYHFARLISNEDLISENHNRIENAIVGEKVSV